MIFYSFQCNTNDKLFSREIKLSFLFVSILDPQYFASCTKRFLRVHPMNGDPNGTVTQIAQS